MKPYKSIGLAIVMATFMAMLGACQKPEGPAERVGKEVDHAVGSVGNKIETVGENIKSTAKSGEK